MESYYVFIAESSSRIAYLSLVAIDKPSWQGYIRVPTWELTLKVIAFGQAPDNELDETEHWSLRLIWR